MFHFITSFLAKQLEDLTILLGIQSLLRHKPEFDNTLVYNYTHPLYK